MSNENKPHPHAHWIKLWADGIPIEYKAGGEWVKVIQFNTMTMPDIEYRIKPEAAAERVKAALKGTTDVNANVGSNVDSPEIDSKPLTDGEVALIKALRNMNIYKVYEGDSLLVFNDEDDGLQVDGDAIAFDSAGRNDEIRACLKKIKAEQEASNEAE